MAFSPIMSWQIDGETIDGNCERLYFGGHNKCPFTLFFSKITADGDCIQEIKRCLLLRRKAMTNLDSVLKRHYFANEGPSSQSYDFSSSHV